MATDPANLPQDRTIAETALAAERAHRLRHRLPPGGLFAGYDWRISPTPFPLGPELARELDLLGRVLLTLYRAVNVLYRHSVVGKMPAWIASWLDQGKPPALLAWQRAAALKSELPRVIRPDLLLTETGMALVELDSVPGGIGLTAWLNQAYAQEGDLVLGGADGMARGFAGIFGLAPAVHIVVSAEAATYRPEMEWLAEQLGAARFAVRDDHFLGVNAGEAVYRFFELFDVPNVANASVLIDQLVANQLTMTPPPKPIFEEKMLFALLWNRNLRSFWRQELGEGFFERLCRIVPYTWLMDPTPLPPHAAIPELNLADWRELKSLSQRDRQLILKVSGFSELAWGARGVHFGSDLSLADWCAAVDLALDGFSRNPYVLQRYHKPRRVTAQWFDFDQNALITMAGRVRLCPYYFVHGNGDQARAQLGGVLATICPADKKIIHGMPEAILAPCVA